MGVCVEKIGDVVEGEEEEHNGDEGEGHEE